MQEFYQSDNKGNRVSHPHTADPILAVWAAPQGATIIIKVPHGYTALHYQTPSDTRTFYIRKLA